MVPPRYVMASAVVALLRSPFLSAFHLSHFHRRDVLLCSRTALQAKAGDAPFTQVISDVDDTLKSSGGVQVAGVYLGGVDTQYARGEYYPGVAEFMLYLGHRQTMLAILTARAEEFQAVLALKANSSLGRALQRAGSAAGCPEWGLGPVLYGSVAEWIVQDRKGWRKFSNFQRLLDQDPSGRLINYVYVGDTGELDEQAGEAMLRQYSDVVKAVFLHVVSDREDEHLAIPPPRFINGRPIIYFRTYVGAALAAAQMGLMDRKGLMAVKAAALEQLDGEPHTSTKWKDVQADVARTSAFLF